ncbi:hypothetical protein NDI45_01775 [Leptolyngbya sp. GB1-A1]|uniref:hypothetical protein n=1 Tax=Leptolyngbya sp. GB1-A1 TaxID=2933908 RepID=UPI0032987BC1
MDMLIVLGTSAAYFSLLFVTLFLFLFTVQKLVSQGYDKTPAIAIACVLLGCLLASCAKRQTSQAIRKLIGRAMK